MAFTFKNNTDTGQAKSRFELQEEGDKAFIEYVYSKKHNRVYILHTEVPDSFPNPAKASVVLIENSLNLIKEQGQTIAPFCPLVQRYLKKHPEYLVIVDEEYKYLLDED
ncbi:MAG: GNAT family N-acetyltransferase [Thermonemataceae bacterium]